MSENHDPVVVEDATPESGGCPVVHGRTHPTQGDANQDWWPNRLNLKILAKNPAVANPMGEEFDYARGMFKQVMASVTIPPASCLRALVTSSLVSRIATSGSTGTPQVQMAART